MQSGLSLEQMVNWVKGFRMTVGNPSTTTLNGTKKGLAYTCLQTILTRGYETPDFPKEPCPAGIMAIQVRAGPIQTLQSSY
jgi:hypothetical protein